MIFSKNLLYCFLVFFFIYTFGFSQRGIISGVIEDDACPLPGVTIIVKGTSNGTETDFDGNYSIECQVNDILLISFVGMTTKEILVTRGMFTSSLSTSIIHEEPVQKIIANAYYKALKKVADSLKLIPEATKNNLTYNKKGYYFNYSKIKDIKEKNGKLKITYFNPDTFYEISYGSNIAFQFIANNSLPKLQNTFAQGKPFNGNNQWFGPETNTIFSFGPSVNTLAFDGANYAYDTHGRLINGRSEKQQLPYTNLLFSSSIILSNNLNLKVSNDTHHFAMNIRRKAQKDIFAIEKNTQTQFDINYGYKSIIKAFLKTSFEDNKQPNTNGFYNNIIQNSYLTPVSFQNNQGYLLENKMQRSFSPTQVNNPHWLLALHKNKAISSTIITGLKADITLTNHLKVNAISSFTTKNNTLDFALPNNTIGFLKGYKSHKKLSEKTLYTFLGVNYTANIKNFSNVTILSTLKHHYNTLNYKLIEQDDFSNLNFNNPINEAVHTHKVQDNTFQFSNEIKFNFDTNFNFEITLKNSVVQSSLQGKKLLLPSAQLYLNLTNIIGYSKWISNFTIATGIAKDATIMPLYYTNLSHNSLLITPQQSPSLLTTNDLFNSNTLALETATNFDIESNLHLFQNTVSIGVNYYTSKTDNAIFPTLENGTFQLQNIASIKNQGWEASLAFNIGRYSEKFHYKPTFLFSKNKATVLRLAGNRTSLPIAGFSTLSKNLIVGEQTGTLVGTAFLRNAKGLKIIGADGYPLVAPQAKIIGNTSPDFTLSINNTIKIGEFNVNFLLDYQHGGDVWNGTQNVLNYTGRSQESANLRGTTHFIFDGVNQAGTTNIIPVDFANPTQDISQNRWVRYGFNGVDEAAIVDGTYLNLKSVSVSYDFFNRNDNTFFKQLEVSLYGYNLFTYTKSAGISPYTSLFDHASAKGLNYFNTPLIKEIGLKVNIKI